MSSVNVATTNLTPDKASHMCWRPVLEGGNRDRALEVIADIARDLSNSHRGWAQGGAADEGYSQGVANASLGGGSAGTALLYAYLARAYGNRKDKEQASLLLGKAIEALAELPMPPSLYGGFTGIAWAASHLQTRPGDAGDDDDPNEAIDEALLGHLSRAPWTDDYDLISGLVGFGLYAAERLPRPSAVSCLEHIVARLDEVALKDVGGGITWFTPPEHLPAWQRELCPDGYCNLGLAHGVPGIIALLGAACAARVSEERARPLLDGAVAWLLRQQLPNAGACLFPAWAAPNLEPSEGRLAWCYGDPGIAAALLVAARGAGNLALEAEAIDVALHAANCPLEQSGVKDAGLCHGSAGLGHLFNRMYQATGEPRLGEAARLWLEQTLAMRECGTGIGGYRAFVPTEHGESPWEEDPGFLTGSTGIALALLAACAAVEPAWDRVLLVSAPGINMGYQPL